MVSAKVSNIVASILVITFAFSFSSRQNQMNQKIRYVALGDSYTICEGASWEESWPYILTKHLNENGVQIELIANPSRTGWTTQNLIDNELSVFDSASPTFATLLIGVNDWVQQVSTEKFHSNLNLIIDHIQKKVGSKLILITIPDFSVTPEGPKYSKGRNISDGLQEFNSIIKKEAEKRNLKYVDIFPVSLKMKNNPELVSADNLHPSAKEYAIWEKLIYPEVYSVLSK
jgi:lysophospholipase L1-like esterase